MTVQTSYYHYDGQGSTLCLTDENGEITDSYAYTAFGEEVDTGTANPTPNPFRYVGQQGYYRDADTQDYYVRARVYRPVLARWLSEDPLLDWAAYLLDGGNPYAYTACAPLTFIDPDGLEKGPVASSLPAQHWYNPQGKEIATPGRYGFWSKEWSPTQRGAPHPDTLGDLIKEAERLAAQDKTCIAELDIEGHGGPWGINIKGGKGRTARFSWATGDIVEMAESIDMWNAAAVGKALSKLPFCCPCIIYLGGCNVGRLAGPHMWIDKIANETGCTVVAPQGESYGTYLSGVKDVQGDENNDYRPALLVPFAPISGISGLLPQLVSVSAPAGWIQRPGVLKHPNLKGLFWALRAVRDKHLVVRPIKNRACCGKSPQADVSYWENYVTVTKTPNYWRRNRTK